MVHANLRPFEDKIAKNMKTNGIKFILELSEIHIMLLEQLGRIDLNLLIILQVLLEERNGSKRSTPPSSKPVCRQQGARAPA